MQDHKRHEGGSRELQPQTVTAVLRLAGAGFAVGLAVSSLAWPLRAGDGLLVGREAFGDWRNDGPGVIRKITESDLPKPFETSLAANPSRVVPQPKSAQLNTMPGFEVSTFATGLKDARVIRVAPNGDIFVALSGEPGKIVVLRATDGATKPDVVSVFADGLDQPFGIAFYPPGPEPQWVYVAETTRVVRFAYKVDALKADSAPEIVVRGLPRGGHRTRDIAFSLDGRRLYVSIGSGSNVGEDLQALPNADTWVKSHAVGEAWGAEQGRAVVLGLDPDGSNSKVFATGLRNCSGLAVQPSFGALFCATNERDLLGDNLPPDYVTRVDEGAFYGWPWYYIGNHADPRNSGARPDLADRVTVPSVLLQPHSAPLGLAFNSGSQFPAAWKGDAFVALHGSWNRTVHTGYKIVRLPFKDGVPTGEYQDLVVGFAANERDVWGRPVGVAFARDGSLLFSDDAGGKIWRVTYRGP